jgi:hypothetical protein
MALESWRRIEDFRLQSDNFAYSRYGGYPGPILAADPIWEWDCLSPRDREGALSELSDWITNVLIGRYRLGHKLPSCWARHPDLVSVLVWLHETEPELSARNAALRGRVTDWEAELRATSEGWPCHCRLHKEGPLSNPRPVLAATADGRPRLLLLDHCLRVLEEAQAQPGAHVDETTARELEGVLARAGVSLGPIEGRRKAEIRLEISDLVLDLARETLAQ